MQFSLKFHRNLNNIKVKIKLLHVSALLYHFQATVHLLKPLHRLFIPQMLLWPQKDGISNYNEALDLICELLVALLLSLLSNQRVRVARDL
jgi:hypothetical protein